MIGEIAREVLLIDDQRARALVAADIPFLDRITADEYTHVESSGTLRTKQQFIAGLRDGAFRFRSFDIDENHAVVYGDTVVVTGLYHNVVVTGATVQPVKHARHLRVYVRRNGTWVNVAHQATQIPPAGAPG